MTRLVLTVIGADRPGLVGALARLVADHEGNWVESRMARLTGHFAGIVSVDVPAHRTSELTAAFRTLAGATLVVHVETALAAPAPPARTIGLDLVGGDRPGILDAITRVLAAHHVNIEELETEVVEAPMSGGALFKAQAVLGLPAAANEDALAADLERIASDVMVELRLHQS